MDKIDVEFFKKRLRVVSEDEDLKRWVNYDIANCYQYMLNIEVDYDKRLQPGELSNCMPDDPIYTDKELVSCVYRDLKVLGYEMCETTLDEPVLPGSWRFAVLNCNPSQAQRGRYDFHFLRQSEKGHWYQKFSEVQHPDDLDFWDQRITNPGKAIYEYKYHLVGYYLAIPNKS